MVIIQNLTRSISFLIFKIIPLKIHKNLVLIERSCKTLQHYLNNSNLNHFKFLYSWILTINQTNFFNFKKFSYFSCFLAKTQQSTNCCNLHFLDSSSTICLSIYKYDEFGKLLHRSYYCLELCLFFRLWIKLMKYIYLLILWFSPILLKLYCRYRVYELDK